jgi:NAD(P)-dependent dehydrogenase (short-subunit alcohol dehydrogenase family)
MPFGDDKRKVVVVTGLSRGIGKSVAEEFAKAGYCVMMNSLHEQDLKAAASEISTVIGDANRVSYFIGDVSKSSVSESLMEETVRRYGRIDVLVNYGKVADEPQNAFERDAQTETNSQQTPYFVLEELELVDQKIKGTYFSIRSAVKRMLGENKRDYSIINIASCQGCMTPSQERSITEFKSGVDPYMDSIASVETITKSTALQLAGMGIRVNGIAPGLVYHDMCEELIESDQKRIQKEREIPIKRIAKPKDISRVALFLASEDAAYITGAMIPVDGGLNLSRPTYFVEVA